MIAVRFDLYWVWGWFDIVMHVAGGFWFGFVVVWFFFFSDYVNIPPRSSIASFLLIALASGFMVGLGWEVFEYVTGQTLVQEGYLTDTIVDLIMDSIGALIAGSFLWWRFRLVKSSPSIDSSHTI